jgi:hypothetical protein
LVKLIFLKLIITLLKFIVFFFLPATNYPGGKPSDPSQNIVIDATGNKNSGLINSARTLWPSWTILLILTMTLTFIVRIQR